MQRSVRSVSLAAGAPSRRASRHTADDAADRGRRARPEPAGRFFSLEEPPPLEAPAGIAEITGWELAAAMWRDHLPEQLLGVDCASCNQAWPCDAWEIADGIISECCEAAQQAAAKS